MTIQSIENAGQRQQQTQTGQLRQASVLSVVSIQCRAAAAVASQ